MGQLASQVAEPQKPSSNGASARTLKSFAPASGELLGEAPIQSAQEVREVVERAHRAQEAWRQQPIEERCQALLRYRHALIDHLDELVDLLSKECGKPRHEALMHELTVVANLISYFVKVAPKVLAPRAIPLKLMLHKKSEVHYLPKGVVAVISPWNYPLQLPLRDAVLALLAGNAVVLKPSEVTPLIALKAKEVWDRAGLNPDLFGVVTGDGSTGAALIGAGDDGGRGVQMVVFTGGVSTGRRVAAACGERLIPCVMELGGKAPLLACADADVERTARGIVFGGFTNLGQVCVSVERVYAHRDIHDALVARVVELTKELKQGDPSKEAVDVGAIIFPHQMTVAEKHIEDALAKGAKLLTGGKKRAGDGQFFEPTVLGECNHAMTVMKEEIFGPIVPIMQVGSEEEAVRLANESHLGLNAYVFSQNRTFAKQLAERIEAGSVLINDVVANGGMPETPFGGIKQSGFGRVLGDDSLREMCDPRHIQSDRISTKDDPLWFPYSEKSYGWFKRATELLFSQKSPLSRL